MSTDFVSHPYFGYKNFSFIITEVGELIFSGHTIKVTVDANTQLFSPLFEPNLSEHSHEL
jgi:hypothetical protein